MEVSVNAVGPVIGRTQYGDGVILVLAECDPEAGGRLDIGATWFEFSHEATAVARKLKPRAGVYTFGYAVYVSHLDTERVPFEPLVGSQQDWAAWGASLNPPPAIELVRLAVAGRVPDSRPKGSEMRHSEPIEVRLAKAQAAAEAMAFLQSPASHFSPAELSNPEPPADVPVWGISKDIIEVRSSELASPGQNLDDAFNRIRADATRLGKGKGRGVLVAVLDTGCQASHPAFAHNRPKCLDATGSNRSGQDQNGHGSWCCGAIGGYDDSDPKAVYSGVAPECTVLSIQVLTAGGWGTDEMIARGVELAIIAEADFISMSLGGSARMPMTEAALKRAAARGIVVFAAAGNEGPRDNTVGYPGRYQETVCVAATTTNGTLAPAQFSSRGPEVDIALPGQSLWGPNHYGKYQRISGTSMATPIGAGAAANILSTREGNHEAHEPALVVADMLDTAYGNQNGGQSNWYGRGVVDFGRAFDKFTSRRPADPVDPVDPPPPPYGDPVKVVLSGPEVQNLTRVMGLLGDINDLLVQGQSVLITTE